LAFIKKHFDMSQSRLQLYRQLQSVKRTKTVLKVINTVRDDLQEDARGLVKQLVEIARIIGIDELMEEMQKGIALLEMEKKY